MGQEYLRHVYLNPISSPLSPVLCYDDFEGGLLWGKSSDEEEAVVEIVDTYAFNTSHCLHVATLALGGAEDEACAAFRPFVVNSLGRFLFSTWFFCLDSSLLKTATFQFNFTCADKILDAILIWEPAEPQFSIISGAAMDPVIIPNSDFTLFPSCWHNVRFSFDLANEIYGNVSVDHISSDMSAYPIVSTVIASSVSGEARIEIVNAGAAQSHLWVDQFSLVSLS